jgi:mRNA interferase MazF
MFRGELWDVQLPAPVGQRPCVVLTRNALIDRLGAVTVAEVSGTEGPGSTHVELGSDAGLTARPHSWVNVTGLHTVPKGKIRRQRGRLGGAEVAHVAAAVRAYLDLDED